ncbi:MAG: hypothetical protein JXR03_01570 [Cyclobacteriaceae bacterium]
MQLTRRQILLIHQASNIYTQLMKSYSAEAVKLPANARMYIIQNKTNVDTPDGAEFIMNEEKEMIKRNNGLNIDFLGICYFFKSAEVLEKFESDDFPKMQQEFEDIRNNVNELGKIDQRKALNVLAQGIETLKNKYIKADMLSQENKEAYEKAYNEFLDDEEAKLEVKVTPLKAEWFERSEVIPEQFLENYIKAELIA